MSVKESIGSKVEPSVTRKAIQPPLRPLGVFVCRKMGNKNSQPRPRAAIAVPSAIPVPDAITTFQISQQGDEHKSVDMLREEILLESRTIKEMVPKIRNLNTECQAAKARGNIEECIHLSNRVVAMGDKIQMRRKRVFHLATILRKKRGLEPVEFYTEEEEQKSAKHILYEMEAIVPVTKILNERVQELSAEMVTASTLKDHSKVMKLSSLIRSTAAEVRLCSQRVRGKFQILQSKDHSNQYIDDWNLFLEAKKKDVDALLEARKLLEDQVGVSDVLDENATMFESEGLNESNAKIAAANQEIHVCNIALVQYKRFCHLMRVSFRHKMFCDAIKKSSARKDLVLNKVLKSKSAKLLVAIRVTNNKFQEVTKQMKANEGDFELYKRYFGCIMRCGGPDKMETAASNKKVALKGNRKEKARDEKDDTDQLPVATASPIDIYDITMRDVVVAIAIPEEPATVGQQTMTSGSAETNETTRHSKPVAANEDPDATDDYADVPEDDFKESLQAMIARMPDLPTGLETPQQEEEEEQEADKNSRKLYAS